MKTIYFFTIIQLLFLPLTTFAKYEPYKFKCTYSASTDGRVEVTSKADPDNDDRTLIMKGLDSGTLDTLEFQDIFVLGHDDNPSEADKVVIDRLAVKLKVNKEKWYTTTQFILFKENPKMVFYKFNSEDGTLGIGIHAKDAMYETFTECKE